MTRMRQRFVVLLRDTPDQQLWLGYSATGRIGNATYEQAFKFWTAFQAKMAVKRLPHKWHGAKVLSTLEEDT